MTKIHVPSVVQSGIRKLTLKARRILLGYSIAAAALVLTWSFVGEDSRFTLDRRGTSSLLPKFHLNSRNLHGESELSLVSWYAFSPEIEPEIEREPPG